MASSTVTVKRIGFFHWMWALDYPEGPMGFSWSFRKAVRQARAAATIKAVTIL